MHTLIIFLLVSGLFALTLVVGWIMEVIVAKLGKTKKAVRNARYRQIVKQNVQHNA